MSSPAAARHGGPAETEYAVETVSLRKTYRRGAQVAVDDLDLRVPRGGVHGFLGPNGSGKTTTIRMLLGLITADSGGMTLFGSPVPEQLPQVIGKVGAIVEAPKFFPHYSGRLNLVLLARAIGADPDRVDAVLDEVGLLDRAKSKFRTYSLGMRQRLAIAATLLKDPELLIFDEPTNGLDPAGIHEIRATMRGLADSGRTVLVSSHILSEVQQVADTVTIIGRGRLLAEGAVSEILAQGGHETVRVRVRDPRRAAEVLISQGFSVERAPDDAMIITPPASRPGTAAFDPATVTETLAREQIFVAELIAVRPDLEQVFLKLTAEEHLGAGHDPNRSLLPPPAPAVQGRHSDGGNA